MIAKEQPYPNITATIYDRAAEITYLCPDGGCKYGLYPVMPRNKTEDPCAYNRHFECLNRHARTAALAAMGRAIKRGAETCDQGNG